MRVITFLVLIALAALVSPSVSAQDDPPVGVGGGTGIKNPYHKTATWRVWRADPTPVEGVRTLVKEGKEKKGAVITLAPTPADKRIYPTGAPRDGEPIRWVTLPEPPADFAGCWDDVYASWSGLHGYVRSNWLAKDGSAVHLRPKGLDQFMHFVEVVKGKDLARCGMNFLHQSTTGMANTITNGYDMRYTTNFEAIYFTDCLVTAPAHASFTETWPDRTADLYLGLMPTLFNSVGSSNSETYAITKLMVAAAYMPPEAKKTLKQHGLYPAALLYMWKAALPYDVPYGHELRHRICYRALGDEAQFPGKYGHAGPERGNLSIEFHRYDEIAHMRNMIRIAMAMKTTPPEAILDAVAVSGGKLLYALKKTAVVIQEPGQDVTVKLSAAKSYDLADRPLSFRLRLLYGTRDTSVTPGDEPGTWVIRVPWDDSLPEGRTAIALIASNGVHDSNPAIVNVYRKHGDLPPTGAGGKGGGFNYNSPHANRRPVFVDLQDRRVKPGEKIEMDIVAIDPEGQPVRIQNRAGEVGALDGNQFTWTVPKDAKGSFPVTFIASDASAGNSYAARRVNFVVAPAAHAHITCAVPFGVAPFKLKVSAGGSVAEGKAEFGWEFYAPAPKRKAVAFAKQKKGRVATHEFTKPGVYEVALTVKSGEATDRQTMTIRVTKGLPPEPAAEIEVQGNGVRIRRGADRPNAFDGTHFGTAAKGEKVTRTFTFVNRFTKPMERAWRSVEIHGKRQSEFRVSRAPRAQVLPGSSATFELEFAPLGGGTRTATVTLFAHPAKRFSFTIAAESAIDQTALDAAAEVLFAPAMKLWNEKKWAAAAKVFREIVAKHPGSKQAESAAGLLELMETQPKMKRALEEAAKEAESTLDLAKQEKRAKSMFLMAENSSKNGRDDLAEKYYRRILKQYPKTTWAAKARERLK